MGTDAKLQVAVESKIMFLRRRAQEIWPRVDLQYPTIRFTLRGRCAGQARWPANQLNFNMTLLRENTDVFICQTVTHEYAHLIAQSLRPGCKPHGRAWQQAVVALGGSARRCHAYDVSNVPSRRVAHIPYACGCRVYQLTGIRHNRIKRGVKYRCSKCGGILTEVGGGKYENF